MSCCKTCEDYDFFGSGLSGLLDLPPNQAGASFSLGVEVSGWDTVIDPDYWSRGGLLADIQQAVQAGGFVQIPVRVYTLTGWANWNPFVVIEGRAKYAHSSASHLRDAILSGVQSVINYDAGSVRFEADTYDQATGLPNTDPSKRRYDAPTGGNNAAVPDPPKGFDWPDWMDKLSYDTGFSQMAIAITGGVFIIGGALMVRRRI